MNEVAALGKILDQTPGVGVWLFVGLLTVYWLREWRETRKLSTDDRLARRDGYAAQVAMLMQENRALRLDLQSLEKRHDEYRKSCQEETAELQRQIIKLEAEVQSMKVVVASDEIKIEQLRRGAA